MKRRLFIQIAAATLASINKLVFAKGDTAAGKPDLLVVCLDKPLSQHAIRNVQSDLKSVTDATGCTIMLLQTGTTAYVANQEKTFFSADDGYRGKLFENQTGVEITEVEKVVWCETTTGLVCCIGKHAADRRLLHFPGGVRVEQLRCEGFETARVPDIGTP